MENQMRNLLVLFCFTIILSATNAQKTLEWTEMKGPLYPNIETTIVLPEKYKLSSGRVEASYDGGESWRLVGTKCTNGSKVIIYSPIDSGKVKLRFIPENKEYPRYNKRIIISSNSDYSNIYKIIPCKNGDYYLIGENDGTLLPAYYNPEEKHEYLYIMLFDKFNNLKNYVVISHPLQLKGYKIKPKDIVLDRNGQLHLLISFRDRIKIGNKEYNGNSMVESLVYINYDSNLKILSTYKFNGLYYLNSCQMGVNEKSQAIFLINCYNSTFEFKDQKVQTKSSTYLLFKFEDLNKEKILISTLNYGELNKNWSKIFFDDNSKIILLVNSYQTCVYNNKELINEENRLNKFFLNYLVLDQNLNLIENKYLISDNKLELRAAIKKQNDDIYIDGITQGKLIWGSHRIISEVEQDYYFMLKLNNKGNIKNLDKLGWSYKYYENSKIYFDKDNNLYLINTASRFSTQLTDFFESNHGYFVSKYDSNFKELWTIHFEANYPYDGIVHDLFVDNNGLIYVANNYDGVYSINNVKYNITKKYDRTRLDVFELVNSDFEIYETKYLELSKPVQIELIEIEKEDKRLNQKKYIILVKNLSNTIINTSKISCVQNYDRKVFVGYSNNDIKPNDSVTYSLVIYKRAQNEFYDTLFYSFANGYKTISYPFYYKICEEIHNQDYINLGELYFKNDTIIELELTTSMINCDREFKYLKLKDESEFCRIIYDSLKFKAGSPIKLKLFLSKEIKGYYSNTILFQDDYLLDSSYVARKCIFVLKSLNKAAESTDDVSSELGPNPVDEYFILKKINEIIDLDIYDVTGRIVKQVRSVARNQKVDVSELTSGCYYIKINNAENNKFYKFIKN